jgi:hypothetical protein
VNARLQPGFLLPDLSDKGLRAVGVDRGYRRPLVTPAPCRLPRRGEPYRPQIPMRYNGRKIASCWSVQSVTCGAGMCARLSPYLRISHDLRSQFERGEL